MIAVALVITLAWLSVASSSAEAHGTMGFSMAANQDTQFNALTKRAAAKRQRSRAFASQVGAGTAAQPTTAAQWDGTAWAIAYPNQRAVNDPLLTAIHAQAQRFWDQRGVRGSGPTRLDVADSLVGADRAGPVTGRGLSPKEGWKDARIILDGEQVGRVARWALNGRNRNVQKSALQSLYAVLAHEEGHARGLPHTSAGLMSDGLPETPGDWRALWRQLINDGLVHPAAKSPRRRASRR